MKEGEKEEALEVLCAVFERGMMRSKDLYQKLIRRCTK